MRKLEIAVLGLLCVTLLMPIFVTKVQAGVILTAASKDAYIDSFLGLGITPDMADYNFGADPRLFVGHWWTATFGDAYQRSLVQFSLPPELSGKTITSATLSLYLLETYTGTSVSEGITVNRVTRDWVEGTGTEPAPTQDGVTWNEYDYYDGLTTPTNDWNTAGGDYTTTDSSMVILPVPTPPGPYWIDWTVTNIVQGWASGTYPNYGFLIMLEEIYQSVDMGCVFSSKESTGPIARLEVIYTVPTEIPEFTIALPVVTSIAIVAYLAIRKRIGKILG